jgi:hypothetical protein
MPTLELIALTYSGISLVCLAAFLVLVAFVLRGGDPTRPDCSGSHRRSGLPPVGVGSDDRRWPERLRPRHGHAAGNVVELPRLGTREHKQMFPHEYEPTDAELARIVEGLCEPVWFEDEA